jgi:hypothetical protein
MGIEKCKCGALGCDRYKLKIFDRVIDGDTFSKTQAIELADNIYNFFHSEDLK